MNTVIERWPLVALLFSRAWLRIYGCLWISHLYDFKIHQRDELVWFSRAGRAVIWGPLDELGVEWLDAYEAQIASTLSAPLRNRGGKFPSAASIAGLTRKGVIYSTPIDTYNSKKQLPAAALAELESASARVVALSRAIWAALPQPIAEELVLATVYAHANENEFGIL